MSHLLRSSPAIVNKTITSVIRQNHAQILKTDIQRRPIDKVLIANRGEIACRVMRTAKKLGIKTVAVYSDADKKSMHVQMADEAYHIGPAPSIQSYLKGDTILEVAKKSGSQAIHPGYGFLSENVEFCEKCTQEGVIFIGPPPSAIRDMGIKSTSKAIMSSAGVPIVKGYHGDDQSIERLQAEAKRCGFPLMIKAVRGGGGKGMRIAMTEEEFLPQLESAKRESLKSFGDESMLLEQYITDPRHVEVQVFADMHGNAVHLFERDCSVQRRHQKVIEEAPAPGLSEETRNELGAAAVRAAKAVGYVGAGTVEFILHRQTHAFHFMEMNTRLQVEHPITEMITGTDLVEWQLRVASGEPLPVSQEEIIRRGHAFECRVYAEEPRAGFLPRAGTLHRLKQPVVSDDTIRIETGVREGDEVSVHYDPMIAKLVVWGRDRNEALAKTKDKLIQYQVAGLETNVNFLLRLSNAPAFMEGDVHTSFIPQHETALFPEDDLILNEERAIQTALGYLLNSQREEIVNQNWKGISVPPAAWRSNYQLAKTVPLQFDGKDLKVRVEYCTHNNYRVQINDGQWYDVEAMLNETDRGLQLITTMNGQRSKVGLLMFEQQIHLYDEKGQTVVELPKPKYQAKAGGDAAGSSDSACSPTPGVLERILVNKGDKVVKGQPLFVVIAMKMEYVVRSPRDGVIATISDVKTGDAVGKGAEIITLETEK